MTVLSNGGGTGLGGGGQILRTAGAFLALALGVTNGCGGAVSLGEEPRRRDGDAGVFARGGSTSTSPGDPGRPTPTRCGDGILQAGESCDTNSLAGQTCASISMGRSSGVLRCTAGCTFDTSSCSTSVPPPFGAGGAPPYGTGGFSNGYAGQPTYPVEAGPPPGPLLCPPGTVADPSSVNACLFGTAAIDACYTWAHGTLPETAYSYSWCGAGCGCGSCATEFSNCLLDPGCASILHCVNAYQCPNKTSCNNLCAGTIAARGGRFGSSDQRADTFDKCLQSVGCTLPCSLEAGIAF